MVFRHRAALLALAVAAAPVLDAPALAQQTPPPAAQAAPTAGQPTPAQLTLAREIMITSGIGRSFDAMLPVFGDQIRQASVSRPEITKDLDEVLVNLQPELELQKQEMIGIAARVIAARLSEAELKDIAAFFRSTAGRRYVETQPQVLDEMVRQTQNWTQRVAEYVMVRVRAEMSKRGHQLQ